MCEMWLQSDVGTTSRALPKMAEKYVEPRCLLLDVLLAKLTNGFVVLEHGL